MTDSSLLRMENIVKRFGSATVVNQVSIDVKAGKVLALLGGERGREIDADKDFGGCL